MLVANVESERSPICNKASELKIMVSLNFSWQRDVQFWTDDRYVQKYKTRLKRLWIIQKTNELCTAWAWNKSATPNGGAVKDKTHIKKPG